MDNRLEYAADYFPYGKVLREWNPQAEKYLTTHHERDTETGLDYRGARYYDADIARFLSLDIRDIEYPRFSDYLYVAGNPILIVDPDGKDLEVTTNGGKQLFVLNDGKEAVTSITAKQLYDRGGQWFEPLADNYMALISVAEGIESFPELKHFTWEQIGEFSTQDRSMISYRQGGVGDWKQSKEGADGYYLITVGGQPYWSDAIGQIPFAVDNFTDNLEKTGDVSGSISKTVETSKQYGEGKIFGGKTDNSNTYDNYFILRGAIWAAFKFGATENKSGGFDLKETNYSPKALSNPVTKSRAEKFNVLTE